MRFRHDQIVIDVPLIEQKEFIELVMKRMRQIKSIDSMSKSGIVNVFDQINYLIENVISFDKVQFVDVYHVSTAMINSYRTVMINRRITRDRIVDRINLLADQIDKINQIGTKSTRLIKTLNDYKSSHRLLRNKLKDMPRDRNIKMRREMDLEFKKYVRGFMKLYHDSLLFADVLPDEIIDKIRNDARRKEEKEEMEYNHIVDEVIDELKDDADDFIMRMMQ